MAIAYTVVASLPSRELREQYIGWLTDGHTAEVIKGGATSAVVLRVDHEESGAWVAEARYTFASRAALETYLRDFAPGLRADGLRRFGPDSGVTFRRSVGEIA
ncbi:MAG: DUF4286 family protein [Phycisphaerales bacterium]